MMLDGSIVKGNTVLNHQFHRQPYQYTKCYNQLTYSVPIITHMYHGSRLYLPRNTWRLLRQIAQTVLTAQNDITRLLNVMYQPYTQMQY